MKRKICSFLLATVLLLRIVFSSVLVIASASVGTVVWGFLVSYFAEKGLDALIDGSPYTPEYKFELLTALRDFCKDKNIDPNSDDFADFLVFAMLEAPDDSLGDYTNAYGENWSDLHSAVHPYMSKLSLIYQMAWVDVQQWIIEHYNDVSTGFDNNGNVQIPIEDLKEELEKQNQTLTPKNRDVVKYSWRDLSNGQTNYDANQLGRLIGKNHQFLDKASYADGVYIQYYGRVPGTAWQVPREGIFDYYSPFQYHIYLENIVEDGYHDSTGAGYPHTKYEWHCDALYYLMIDGERSYTVDTVITTFEDTMSGDTYHNAYGDFSYLNIGFMQGGNIRNPMFSSFYDNSAMAHSAVSYKKTSYPDFNATEYLQLNPRYFLNSDDVSKKLDSQYLFGYANKDDYISKSSYSTTFLYSTLSNFEKYHDDDIFDYGFYASTEPFTTTYMFDITRLPSNSTVTISGDSVYDYSITDNSTGDTSTIYNYVTNNYAYPEKPDNTTSGGSGSGGSVGGHITVGGQVDVGGKVEIDVNINGGNGGNGGINGNIGDYVGDNSDIDTDLDNYLGLVPKLSKSFIAYMKDFFSWLPKEIYGLIVLCFIFLLIRVILPKGR